MKTFKDFFKRDNEEKNYYLTKSSNGLPMWVIEPPILREPKHTPTQKEKQNE